MATSVVNGVPSAEGNATISTPSMGKQQQSKAAATGAKSVDSNRKQAGNASEGTQRQVTIPIRYHPHCASNHATQFILLF